ncbi:hypothetical protein RIR_jg38441.t1 [Rhizophagus irregularis DAOM 181602=DAOM 197198]|nr:hypothetical protein RIR_jg38441.t1 [Rhizophagus irregularis DAOM 181602=DAOM 197198]
MVHTVFVYDDDEFDVILETNLIKKNAIPEYVSLLFVKYFCVNNVTIIIIQNSKHFAFSASYGLVFINEASFSRREIEETSIFIVIVKNSHLLITSTPDLLLMKLN